MDILKVFIFSFSISIIIGPIAIIVINNGLKGGLKSASIGAFGVLIGSFFLTLIAFFTDFYLMNPISLENKYINISASVVLILFGIWIIYQALTTNILKSDLKKTKPKRSRTFLTPFLLALLNPFNFVAFLTFSSKIEMKTKPSIFLLAMVAAIANFIAIEFYAILSGFLFKLKNPCILKYINVGSGILLIVFGILNFFN
ncbi:LysE family transporter [Aureivirga sp. CE67]|uniref:LysE family transporter n=1 Tax=Aureivirga sp. CE67 TaxID=1788983 RepID=UPI0018C93176|nr:LysE family transporter [Aureivirga sp. CE67]